MIGRGTRIPDGIQNLTHATTYGIPMLKRDCLVMDFVDNCSKHSLITLPLLFGLSTDLDFAGQTITEVLKNAVKLNASVILAPVTHKLTAVEQNVDFFGQRCAPDVIDFADFAWEKTGPAAYMLVLGEGEYVAVTGEANGRWRVTGAGRGQLDGTLKDLEHALRWGRKTRCKAMGDN